jgi:hypothetical protein
MLGIINMRYFNYLNKHLVSKIIIRIDYSNSISFAMTSISLVEGGLINFLIILTRYFYY